MHVVCGYYGSPAVGSLPPLEKILWSETIASGGTSSNAAPAATAGQARPILRVYSSVAAYVVPVATGGDATQTNGNTPATARQYVPANTFIDIYVQPGHKLTWAAA